MINIYVGNLPYSCTENQLRETFEEYGEVSSANLIIDKYSGRSKGFGFVEMPDNTAANAAMEALNGTEMDGRPLKVNEAKPREERPRRDRY